MQDRGRHAGESTGPLRATIAQLRFELACRNELIATLRARLERELPGRPVRCVYCGAHSRGRVCVDHRDLIALDPELDP